MVQTPLTPIDGTKPQGANLQTLNAPGLNALGTDGWAIASWDEFLSISEDPLYAKAKAYYFNGLMRIETMGVGPDHASNNGIFHLALVLFCSLQGIPIKGLINASYRRPKTKETQPDISYYVGDRAILAPQGRAIANLEQQPIPDLAIEIADSSIDDDLGRKRLLYEALGIPEYWVVDVEQARIIAFQIIDGGSRRIERSLVIPGLDLTLLEQVLMMSRNQDDSQVLAWLMQQCQTA